MSELRPPSIDPTPIFEHYRGSFGSELLTAAITEFNLFERLAAGPRSADTLERELGLAARPCTVLLTAMRAMGLLADDSQARVNLTRLAREHLVRDSPFDVSGYVGMSKDTPGVRTMIERLRTNRPAGHDDAQAGTAFIYRPEVPSAMELESSARQLTLALAGRAKNVAPVLADRVLLDDARKLLDVGGGTGIYSIAWLCQHQQLRAVVWDRPEVLKIADEMAREYGVADRLELVPGDMFTDRVPEGCDVCLLSNVLHDWDVPECRKLIERVVTALPSRGRLIVHDVLLDDGLDGPLPVALYSAALFSVTEGRAYSAAEYGEWLLEAGLTPDAPIPTLVHCSAIVARKS
jgi:predicted O-methyltransferase YrrM